MKMEKTRTGAMGITADDTNAAAVVTDVRHIAHTAFQ
jgi:hypothetical protein